jgi:hypothetical protein
VELDVHGHLGDGLHVAGVSSLLPDIEGSTFPGEIPQQQKKMFIISRVIAVHQNVFLLKCFIEPGTVAHTYNPSYSLGGDRRITV